MRRILAILGSAIFLVIAPGIVAGYVPWWISRWHVGAPLLGTSLSRLVGVLLIVSGIPVLLDSFARFALQGLGTPAPIFPTRHLVVSGFFQYVRNPMYVAVVSLIQRLEVRLPAKFLWPISGNRVNQASEPEIPFRPKEM